MQMTREKRKLSSEEWMAIGVLAVIVVLSNLAVVGRMMAMRVDSEAPTLQYLRTIATVEVHYFNTHKRTFGTLDELVRDQGLSSQFNGHPAVADGYVFTLTLATKPNGSSAYKVTADPQDKTSGTNHFYIDSDDQSIHVNAERQAGPADPLQ
jgi:hypothetical protein